MNLFADIVKRFEVIRVLTVLGSHVDGKLRHRAHELVSESVHFRMNLFADIVKRFEVIRVLTVLGSHVDGKLRHRAHELVFEGRRLVLYAGVDVIHRFADSVSSVGGLVLRRCGNAAFELLDRIFQFVELCSQIADRLLDLFARRLVDIVL